MAKILISPGKYVQGAGEMANLGEYVAKLGKKALIVVDMINGFIREGNMKDSSIEKIIPEITNVILYIHL